MKVVFSASFATALVCIASPISAQSRASGDSSSVGHVYGETVNRTDVPVGTKTYYTGLSTTENGPNKCSGVLISPKHVLTTAGCMTRDPRWVSIGAQRYNTTNDGEKIQVKAMLLHPEGTTFSNDLMVLELEKASSVTPVSLAAVDGSDTKPGQGGQYLGWQYTQETDTTPIVRGEKLQSAGVKIISNEQCETMLTINKSNVCASGLANEDPCQGSFGSPLIVEKADRDVVVGLVSWRYDCNLSNTPAVFASVMGAQQWIESATKNMCFP